MTMREVAPDIDFADSSYRSCEMHDNNLTVYLNSWDEKILKIVFLTQLCFFIEEAVVLQAFMNHLKISYF